MTAEVPTEEQRREDVISGWLMALWFVVIVFVLFGLPALALIAFEKVFR